MTQFLVLIALCSPQVDGGIRLGGGLLEESPMVMVQPWIGVQLDTLDLAMGPPIRLDLEDGELRSKDWDEVADYGRLVHRLRWGNTLRAGVISHRSLGNGTLVRRYHNGVDLDHARLGLEVRIQTDPSSSWTPNHYEFMVDQILARPVIAGALGYANSRGHLVLNGAADFAYPSTLDGGVDEYGWPRSTRSTRGGFGLSGRYHVWAPSPPYSVFLLGDLDALTNGSWGAHAGLGVRFRQKDRWMVEFQSNLMALGDGYTWSLFDTGYLIDRWRGLDTELDEAAAGLGTRSNLQITYLESVIWGIHYADTQQEGRADLGTWLRVPLKRATVGAYWRVRRVDAGTAFFDLDEVMAAISARAALTKPLSVEFTLSRDWFSQESGEYAPHTSVFLNVEASWSTPR